VVIPADTLLGLAFNHAMNSFRSLAGILFLVKRERAELWPAAQ
jgi:hypothetical protein